MPKSPPVVQRQTIKQAKAAFKARGRPAISEAEKKQLERSLELDRRAWRSKEQEKRKADLVKKRQDKERKEKEERQKAMMGTQRRCDKFGYKSSQFHLGAFFGGGAVKRLDNGQEDVKIEEEEAFGDDDVDDETLLDALESPNHARSRQQHPQSDSAMPSTSLWEGHSVKRSTTEPPPIVENELSSFWDELGSSTQIARELEPISQLKQASKPDTRTSSFNSGDFDLSAEDLEELEPAKPAVSKVDNDRKLMPPPALPLVIRKAPKVSYKAPEVKPAVLRADVSVSSVVHHSRYAGFTIAELEGFLDDDLQLTQAAPG
ncbi:hypothetical protein LTR85_003521 [Meristemomyces frigidus]|nr:hypothetical protein LTR85_003521 [Meristemomyces frigidus]